MKSTVTTGSFADGACQAAAKGRVAVEGIAGKEAHFLMESDEGMVGGEAFDGLVADVVHAAIARHGRRRVGRGGRGRRT